MKTPKFIRKISNYFRAKSLKAKADALEENILLYGGHRPIGVNEADKKYLLEMRKTINQLLNQ